MNIDLYDIATALLGIALLLALARGIIGPSLPDRVVALELTSMTSVGLVLVHAASEGKSYLIDIAIVLALVAFLSTVAFASYLEQRGPE
jgi:multicomponent Na+:H+ antiporter subunit F